MLLGYQNHAVVSCLLLRNLLKGAICKKSKFSSLITNKYWSIAILGWEAHHPNTSDFGEFQNPKQFTQKYTFLTNSTFEFSKLLLLL